MTTRYKPKADNIAATVIDGEAIIVNLTTGVYYSMDKVGADVWGMIEQEWSLDEISAAIAARHDVTADRALADVEALAAKLIAEDLMELAADSLPRRDQPAIAEQRTPYEAPSLQAYRDMGDLLALDPPMPGLRDIPLQKSADLSGP